MSSRGRGSNSKRLSRPVRTLCTIPTSSNTRRCLVMACRVSRDSSVSWEIERGGRSQSLATSFSRVSSPSAAKMRAWTAFGATRTLRVLGDIGLDILHLRGPTALVHPEGLEAPVAGKLVESRLGHRERGADRRLFQPEFDEGGRFRRVIHLGIDGSGMPGKGKEPLRLHFFHLGRKLDVLVTRISDVAMGRFPRNKGALQFDAKPLAEFPVVG